MTSFNKNMIIKNFSCLDKYRLCVDEQVVSSFYLALSGAGKCLFGRQTKVMAIELLSAAHLLECFPFPFLLLKGYQGAA